MQKPSAVYTNGEDTEKVFTLDGVKVAELTSNGATTGPSPYLLEFTNGEYVDKDKPSDLDLNNKMSVLRGYVTRLQDDINVYLTEKIGKNGGNVEEDNDDGDDNVIEDEDVN